MLGTGSARSGDSWNDWNLTAQLMTKSHVLDFDWAWCEAASSSTQAGAFQKKVLQVPELWKWIILKQSCKFALYLEIAFMVRWATKESGWTMWAAWVVNPVLSSFPLVFTMQQIMSWQVLAPEVNLQATVEDPPEHPTDGRLPGQPDVAVSSKSSPPDASRPGSSVGESKGGHPSYLVTKPWCS